MKSPWPFIWNFKAHAVQEYHAAPYKYCHSTLSASLVKLLGDRLPANGDVYREMSSYMFVLS